MRVRRLSLTDFRSYAQVDLEFGPRATTLVGRNGAGKTNIVEALRYLSTLSSHRVAVDAPLIRAGQSAATIRATIEKSGRSLALEVVINDGRPNTARVNRGAARPRELLGILRTVVFSPEDLSLVKGDPGERRRFLDEIAIALSPRLAGDVSDYERVLRQRSTLLKTAKGRPGEAATLDIWDEKLADLGGVIVRARLDAVAALADPLARAYAEVSGGGTSAAAYSPHRPDQREDYPLDASAHEISNGLREAMQRLRPKEVERGVCLVGPHRDELDISIGGLPARGYASHGESWSAALALRLATYDVLTADGGPDSDPDGEPVLILDDVFAELDSSRRRALATRAASAQQVVITAAVEQDVPDNLETEVLYVGEGEVNRGPATR